jgi:hypothetical protein
MPLYSLLSLSDVQCSAVQCIPPPSLGRIVRKMQSLSLDCAYGIVRAPRSWFSSTQEALVLMHAVPVCIEDRRGIRVSPLPGRSEVRLNCP